MQPATTATDPESRPLTMLTQKPRFSTGNLCVLTWPAPAPKGDILLGWNQEDLATRAGVSQVTVHQLEAGVTQPRRATLDVIRRAFENAGVEFIDENGGGPGLRLRKPTRDKPRK